MAFAITFRPPDLRQQSKAPTGKGLSEDFRLSKFCARRGEREQRGLQSQSIFAPIIIALYLSKVTENEQIASSSLPAKI